MRKTGKSRRLQSLPAELHEQHVLEASSRESRNIYACHFAHALRAYQYPIRKIDMKVSGQPTGLLTAVYSGQDLSYYNIYR